MYRTAVGWIPLASALQYNWTRFLPMLSREKRIPRYLHRSVDVREAVGTTAYQISEIIFILT